MTDLDDLTIELETDLTVWTFPGLGRSVVVGTMACSLWDEERLFVHSIEEM